MNYSLYFVKTSKKQWFRTSFPISMKSKLPHARVHYYYNLLRDSNTEFFNHTKSF